MTLERQESELSTEANVTLRMPSQKQLKQERALQLLYSLHASLDIKSILQSFAQAVEQEIDCDGIHYQHATTNTSLQTAAATDHELNYNLALNEAQLGQLHFFKQSPFTEDDTTKLEDLLILLMQPLRNAISHEFALRGAMFDPLTGLYNRMNLDDVLKREIQLAKRHRTAFSILTLDIDHFKQINDQYGHPAGDAYLKDVAATLESTVRDSDSVYRMGGEEFLILCPKADAAGAQLLAERLRENLSNLICEYHDYEIQTTSSVGFTSFDEVDDSDKLLARADKALYAAKNAGRNCVRTAS